MKNKKTTKSLTSSFFDSKQKIIGAGVIAAVVIILVAVFMIIESGYGNWIIKNKTDLNLEYVKTSFINAEGNVEDGIDSGKVNAQSTYKSELDQADLKYTESNMEVRFKFENSEEMFTDVGYFVDNFDGNVTISFEKTDDPNLITLKIKAKNGIFQTKTVDCDAELTINLSEGKIYE